MPNKPRGSEICVRNLSVDELNDLSKKARELLEQITKPDRQMGSPYRELAIVKTEEYLWLILQSANMELKRREWAQKHDRLYWELNVLGTLSYPAKTNEVRARAEMRGEIGSYASEVQRHSREIDRLGAALAALPAVATNEFLTEIGLPHGSSLRPDLPEERISPATRESKVKEFRSFAAQWWRQQQPKAGRWRVSDKDLADFAAQCDSKKFKPNSAFLPLSVWRPIKKYNSKPRNEKIITFTELIVVFGKVASGGGLRPFKVWLSTNAKNAKNAEKRGDHKR